MSRLTLFLNRQADLQRWNALVSMPTLQMPLLELSMAIDMLHYRLHIQPLLFDRLKEKARDCPLLTLSGGLLTSISGIDEMRVLIEIPMR